jgi:hypothetical protein
MNKYTTQSEANRNLAARQTHGDMHAGPGVINLPKHDEIARRAYSIYVKSGSKKGHCTANWSQAERELRTDAVQP